MGILTILAIYISFILLLVFVLLFGPSPRFRNGVVGKLHTFITETIWTFLGKAITKICGQNSLSKFGGCWSYLSEQRNPSLQLLYLFFITGCIGVFLYCGYDLLAETNLHWIHHDVIIPVMIVFTYVCFFVASSVGPGKVDAHNVKAALEKYPYDYLLFDPKICGTCKIQKPARSKHCSLCNMCVARSDHHCGWINQCVGHNNHRYFILFLYSAFQVCWYGSFLIYHVFTSRMYDSPMYKFLVATNQWEQLGFLRGYHIFLYQMQTDKSLGALAIFASLAGLVIFIFFIYNLYLIATGVTTNESFKWEDIGEMIYRRELVEVIETDMNGAQLGPKRYEQRDRRHPSHPRYVEPSASQQSLQQQHQQKRPQPLPRPAVERVITKMKEIENIYDRGVKENLSSILWPPSLDSVSLSVPVRRAGLSAKKGA
ncbi:palmitoyltransferase ZDHHC4 [Entomortierella parvispora]|uniref:Palmitoyltransferase n=1 Tax=Entomortierella parvispora TaxID=205924 RepID=A0A9P3HFF7_9FUNG|nr:palmitoyltransferase ZDHHC4 [Entomortierella parvispora]